MTSTGLVVERVILFRKRLSQARDTKHLADCANLRAVIAVLVLEVRNRYRQAELYVTHGQASPRIVLPTQGRMKNQDFSSPLNLRPLTVRAIDGWRPATPALG